jgi:hypothetical protein
MAGRKAKAKGKRKAPKPQRTAKKPTAKQKPKQKPTQKQKQKQKPKQKPLKATKKAAPPKATPARDARQALEAKKAIRRTLTPPPDGKAVVEAYLRDLDHPFKQEIEAVRAIILGASDKLAERIKWNAPSFHYKEDLGAFNPRATEYAHLILLFPGGAGMDDASGLLEGNHKDRREARFHSLDDVKAKRPALEKLVKQWIALRDR